MSLKFLPACVLAFTVVSGHAARPLQTDDAGVIPAGTCEVEGSRSVDKLAGASARAVGAALACGMGLRSQLGWAAAATRGAGEVGRGAALLGKTGLWSSEGDDAPALAMSWSLDWAKTPGSGWEREGSEVRLLGTVPLGTATLHGNLGQRRDRASGLHGTLWGVAMESHEAAAGPLLWAPMAEVYGDDRGDRWAAAGLRVTLVPNRLFVDISSARQLRGQKARTSNAGIKFAF